MGEKTFGNISKIYTPGTANTGVTNKEYKDDYGYIDVVFHVVDDSPDLSSLYSGISEPGQIHHYFS